MYREKNTYYFFLPESYSGIVYILRHSLEIRILLRIYYIGYFFSASAFRSLASVVLDSEVCGLELQAILAWATA